MAKLERNFHQAKRDLDKIQSEVKKLEDELKQLGDKYVNIYGIHLYRFILISLFNVVPCANTIKDRNL